MADDLDAAIEAARTERKAAKDQADHWARRVELLDARLGALEEAAKFRPARTEPLHAKAETGNGGRGRQPGAISKHWRNVLLSSAEKYPDGASEMEFTDLARAEGLSNVRLKDVRSRMENYQKHSYVQPAPKGWQVTSHAVAKFGSEITEDGSHQAADEIEAADVA